MSTRVYIHVPVQTITLAALAKLYGSWTVISSRNKNNNKFQQIPNNGSSARHVYPTLSVRAAPYNG